MFINTYARTHEQYSYTLIFICIEKQNTEKMLKSEGDQINTNPYVLLLIFWIYK